MSRYLVELRQETILHVTVEADDVHEARSRALSSDGEHGDPIHSEPEIVSVRPLEPVGAV